LSRTGPAAPPPEAIAIRGGINILLLAGVIAAVLAAGFWVHPHYGEVVAPLFQSSVLAALSLVSLVATPRSLREENEFSWQPYLEVVVLFVGIFTAMIPALGLLRTKGASLGVSEPWHFFVATGGLSAFLDNAPTYLAFFTLA